MSDSSNDPWAYEHEDYSRADWRNEVINEETLQGYRAWVYSQLEADGREDEIDREPIIVEVKDNAVRAVYNVPSGVVVRVEDHDITDTEIEFDESALVPGTRVHVQIYNASPDTDPDEE